jgi:hypothetical protein
VFPAGVVCGGDSSARVELTNGEFAANEVGSRQQASKPAARNGRRQDAMVAGRVWDILGVEIISKFPS